MATDAPEVGPVAAVAAMAVVSEEECLVTVGREAVAEEMAEADVGQAGSAMVAAVAAAAPVASEERSACGRW